MTPERLNALEQQLIAAMQLDSSRDIYFDRHGEDVIRELIEALRARPEVEALSAAVLLRQVRDEWYRFTSYSQLKADIDEFLERHEPQPGRSSVFCPSCGAYPCLTTCPSHDAAPSASTEEKK